MTSIKPIFGTTQTGTDDIFNLWINGNKEKAVKMLVLHISVNKPEILNNTEWVAKDTIEKWIEDNF